MFLVDVLTSPSEEFEELEFCSTDLTVLFTGTSSVGDNPETPTAVEQGGVCKDFGIEVYVPTVNG